MAEIVKIGEKYGVRLEKNRYADIGGDGPYWAFPEYAKYCLGSLEQARRVMETYQEPVVVDLTERPKFTVIEPTAPRINIDRHDLYFFLAAQIVIILLAGVYFK